MSKKRLLAIIVLSATLAATGAVAHVTHEPLDAVNRGVAEQRDSEEAVVRRLLEQFRTVNRGVAEERDAEEAVIRGLLEQFRTVIPLSQAVAIAEHLHDGSKAADVNFEISGPPVYRVRTIRNERIWENVIDAKTGSVTESETSSSLRELNREDLGNITALRSVEQKLSDAVRIAEKAAEGSALSANLMKRNGKLNFVVLIANGDGLKEVMLEPPKVTRGKTARH